MGSTRESAFFVGLRGPSLWYESTCISKSLFASTGLSPGWFEKLLVGWALSGVLRFFELVLSFREGGCEVMAVCLCLRDPIRGEAGPS